MRVNEYPHHLLFVTFYTNLAMPATGTRAFIDIDGTAENQQLMSPKFSTETRFVIQNDEFCSKPSFGAGWY